MMEWNSFGLGGCFLKCNEDFLGSEALGLGTSVFKVWQILGSILRDVLSFRIAEFRLRVQNLKFSRTFTMLSKQTPFVMV